MNQLVAELPFKTKITDFLNLLVYRTQYIDYQILLDYPIGNLTIKELLSLYVTDCPRMARMLGLDEFESESKEFDIYLKYITQNLDESNDLSLTMAKLIVKVEKYIKFEQV
jgi:hypothetical protein